ncbi:FAD-dependent oxidoreductase [Paenibacillus sp. LPE1-1-1.1]|uniref:FAD-dependent oxidoreductase n=1 Tax=Paenibacillus sp. LPE1-1-1.1 TaxID=3135230 RepID=UPI003428B1D7
MESQTGTADVIVVGGGLGGCMAALSAVKLGMNVILTEATDWIGGQLTSQAVPPDEHPWIESFGCTSTYREFRDRIRRYYKENYPLTDAAKNNERLNPGNGWVSRLCHEPKAALHVLEAMLAPYISSGRLTLLLGWQVESAETNDDRIDTVHIKHSDGRIKKLRGSYYLDATECGDLLPLAGVEYVSGAEAKSETGEPHALDFADALDMQSFTYVFALDHIENGNFTIAKPEQYDFWRSFIPAHSRFPLFGWKMGDLHDPSIDKEIVFLPDGKEPMPFWTYRRILDRSLFSEGFLESDITLINWAQNDYYLGPIYGVSEEERQTHLKGARQQSLSLVYWLQTEAPRPDGGKGYPGLRLRGDVLGTEDGIAKHPYIRESRRIKAVYTITEHDVSLEIRGTEGIKRYEDSVGVGSYHLDLHTTTKSNRGFFIPSLPYEIPLGAFLPVRVKNLLPACKNIGTTQITNGCYRLHPTEWNIGEAAGYLAAYSMMNQVTPHEVRENKEHLNAFLTLITNQGIETHWPDSMKL